MLIRICMPVTNFTNIFKFVILGFKFPDLLTMIMWDKSDQSKTND